MKIGFSQDYNGPGGVRSWIKSFSNYCLSKGHDISFGYDPDVDVFCSVAAMSKIEELEALKNKKIKILQRIGAIFLPYNYPSPELVKSRNDYFKKIISFADSIVYQSIFSKTVLLRSIYNGNEPDGDIIYNSVDASVFTPDGKTLHKPKNKKVILSIAYWGTQYTSAKSIQALINVAKLFKSKKNIEFWILGKAFPNDEKLVRNANLPNITKLDLSTPVPRDLMPEYLRTADLLLSFKAHEACPNLVIEAMHTGTPLVGLNSGSLPELVEDAALLANCSQSINSFPTVDMHDLCKKILETLHNQEFYRKKMLARAKIFSEKETHEKYLNKLEELYHLSKK
jgi:glycosyltransferase involved in cell wall biosynthesis